MSSSPALAERAFGIWGWTRSRSPDALRSNQVIFLLQGRESQDHKNSRHKGETPKCTIRSSWVGARPARSWPHRLSAKSASKILLLEAGQDTPPGSEPAEIRDSYPGTVYFDPRFHWTSFGSRPRSSATTTPRRSVRRSANTSRRACWAAARRSTARWPTVARRPDYNEWEARGAAGWSWRDVLPFFQEGRARSRFRRAAARQGRPHSRPSHSAGALDAALAGHGRGLQAPPGYKFCRDQNGEFTDGYFPVTHSNEARSSAFRRRWAISIAIPASAPI